MSFAWSTCRQGEGKPSWADQPRHRLLGGPRRAAERRGGGPVAPEGRRLYWRRRAPENYNYKHLGKT